VKIFQLLRSIVLAKLQIQTQWDLQRQSWNLSMHFALELRQSLTCKLKKKKGALCHDQGRGGEMAQDSQPEDLSFLLNAEAHESLARLTTADLTRNQSVPSPLIPAAQTRDGIKLAISKARREISRLQSLLENKPLAPTANFLIYTSILTRWRETLKRREEELVVFDAANAKVETQATATAAASKMEIPGHAVPALSPAGHARVEAFAEAARLARRKRFESGSTAQ
jgi:hypothetical protein